MKKLALLLLILSFGWIVSCNSETPDQEAETKTNSKNEVLGIEEISEKFYLQTFTKPIAFPDLIFETLNGKQIGPAEMKDKVLFINFWATWCPPCLKELPDMEKLNNQLKDSPFLMLVINSGEREEIVKKFVKKHAYQFQIALDENRLHSTGFGIQGLPTTLLVDRKGILLAQAVGPRDWSNPEMIAFLKHLTTQN